MGERGREGGAGVHVCMCFFIYKYTNDCWVFFTFIICFISGIDAEQAALYSARHADIEDVSTPIPFNKPAKYVYAKIIKAITKESVNQYVMPRFAHSIW